MRRVLWLGCAVAVLAWAAAPPPRVRFLHPPRFLPYDSPVTLTIRVEHKPDHRGLRVEALDDAMIPARSSFEQLEGAEAPLSRVIEWQPLGQGDYSLVAVVLDTSGHVLGRDIVSLRVFGPGGP